VQRIAGRTIGHAEVFVNEHFGVLAPFKCKHNTESQSGYKWGAVKTADARLGSRLQR
jgi:hypothetical protein